MERYDKVYGLIGWPLGHSFSQTYFNEKFASENISAHYYNFEIPDIGDVMEIFAEYANLSGLNVTIPYKQQIIPYLDALSPTAKAIGAVNVVKIIRRESDEMRLEGHNSDAPAFADTLRPLLQPWQRKALVLGTGGASKAVCYALKTLGVEPTLVSRKAAPGRLSYSELSPQIMEAHTVIVNTTPLGMYPNVEQCAPIPYDLVTDRHLCYDLIYNPDTTEFMRRCAEHGATVKNGLEMLLLQAFLSYQIWEGK